jgi:hypothetical protein
MKADKPIPKPEQPAAGQDPFTSESSRWLMTGLVFGIVGSVAWLVAAWCNAHDTAGLVTVHRVVPVITLLAASWKVGRELQRRKQQRQTTAE